MDGPSCEDTRMPGLSAEHISLLPSLNSQLLSLFPPESKSKHTHRTNLDCNARVRVRDQFAKLGREKSVPRQDGIKVEWRRDLHLLSRDRPSRRRSPCLGSALYCTRGLDSASLLSN
jgi:CRP-like cAMP-binding protein